MILEGKTLHRRQRCTW